MIFIGQIFDISFVGQVSEILFQLKSQNTHIQNIQASKMNFL
jgi:hypothetical protein